MKNLTKQIVFLLLTVIVVCSCATSKAKKKADKDTKNWRYEIEAVGTGTEGSYLIKVFSYSKKPEVATEQAKKNAVHGVIFKGFAGIAGVPGQRALASNPSLEMEKEEYFNSFFADGGKYMKYVNESKISVAASDRLKIGKEYKIGITVSVSVAALRKELESAGIIRSLGSGF